MAEVGVVQEQALELLARLQRRGHGIGLWIVGNRLAGRVLKLGHRNLRAVCRWRVVLGDVVLQPGDPDGVGAVLALDHVEPLAQDEPDSCCQTPISR